VKYAELKAKFEATKAKALAITHAATDAESRPDRRRAGQVLTFITEAKGYDDQARKLKGDNDVRAQLEALGFTAPEAITEQLKAGAVRHGGQGRVARRPLRRLARVEALAEAVPGWRIPDSDQGADQPAGRVQGRQGPADRHQRHLGRRHGLQRRPAGLIQLGRRPLNMRSIVTQGTTSSDTVEYVQVTAETNNAAPVAEATDVGGSVGVKPAVQLRDLARVTDHGQDDRPLDPATKRALSDAGPAPDPDRQLPPLRPGGGARRPDGRRATGSARTSPA
jgi:hypothetical protein